jgi:hypothetical protein
MPHGVGERSPARREWRKRKRRRRRRRRREGSHERRHQLSEKRG